MDWSVRSSVEIVNRIKDAPVLSGVLLFTECWDSAACQSILPARIIFRFSGENEFLGFGWSDGHSASACHFYIIERKDRDRQGGSTTAYYPRQVVQAISLTPTLYQQNTAAANNVNLGTAESRQQVRRTRRGLASALSASGSTARRSCWTPSRHGSMFPGKTFKYVLPNYLG
jgi:hypothetical protein